MEKNIQVPKHNQFRAFYMFFVIFSMQAGVGILGTPRIVFLEAGHDSWISSTLTYLYVAILLMLMLYILRQYDKNDILGIQADLFGNFISKVIGTIYLIYFSLQLLSILVTYIEVIKVFVFPESQSLILGLMLILPIIYTLLGGLRVTIGVVFIFIFITYWVLILLIEPLRQIDFLNFLPIMDRGISDIMRGVVANAYTFSGFEILFFIYPFVERKDRITKPVILGTSFISFLILLSTTIAIGFLSPDELQRRIWPLLNLYKVQTSPIIERLDYVVIAEWMMVVLPKAILLMWCISYIAIRMYNFPKKASIYVFSILILVCIPFFNEHFVIQKLIDSTKYIAYGLVYIYPLFLLPLVVIKKRVHRKKKGRNHANR